jgi:transcriptional regulator with XRE-family HTH domain
MSTPIQRMAVHGYNGHNGAVLASRISENIRRLRLEKGWSRPQLGARLTPPTSGQQIEKLEKGDRRLTVDWIERVSKALGVDPAELIAGQGEQFTLTEPVANEVALTLARIVLEGGDPSPAIVGDLATVLIALSETFARHPQARRDPDVARPVVDLLAQRHARRLS